MFVHLKIQQEETLRTGNIKIKSLSLSLSLSPRETKNLRFKNLLKTGHMIE